MDTRNTKRGQCMNDDSMESGEHMHEHCDDKHHHHHHHDKHGKHGTEHMEGMMDTSQGGMISGKDSGTRGSDRQGQGMGTSMSGGEMGMGMGGDKMGQKGSSGMSGMSGMSGQQGQFMQGQKGDRKEGMMGMGMSHATGDSKLPKKTQEMIPGDIEKAMPDSFHNTSGTGRK